MIAGTIIILYQDICMCWSLSANSLYAYYSTYTLGVVLY
uniref:Uncharacterized protein n=1 Tax=Arundo donax TaxID=35708 RepID=A0A0A9APL0_ARUDO